MTVLNSVVPNPLIDPSGRIYADPANPAQRLSHRVGFYVFHMAPEWIVSAALSCLDVRGIWDTHLWGDWKNKDDEKSLADLWRKMRWKMKGGKKNGPPPPRGGYRAGKADVETGVENA